MAKIEKTHPLFFWRKEKGKSLQALATDLECTQSFLSQIELGEKQPSLGMAARLQRVTGLPMESFLKEQIGEGA
jgi:transcriptional regulator with XRE-family HTH domain